MINYCPQFLFKSKTKPNVEKILRINISRFQSIIFVQCGALKHNNLRNAIPYLPTNMPWMGHLHLILDQVKMQSVVMSMSHFFTNIIVCMLTNDSIDHWYICFNTGMLQKVEKW